VYASHFGLSLLPFENAPDPAFFFNAGEYQRILQRLTAAVAAGRGLMVVAGPIGSGKTTLSQKLMSELPEGTETLWLAEPPGTDRELFQLIQQQLKAVYPWDSRVLALGVLRERLLELHAAGGHFLVVVDESHKFSDEGLEAVRLLNNLEQGATKLVQILMLGQEELVEMLTRAGREPFRQRITNFEMLGRMTPPQVRNYVHHRLRVAGGRAELFPDLLLEAVAEACGGIPRLTNSLCDRSLLYAFEGGRSAVDAKDLLKAAEDVGVYRKAFHFLVGRRGSESVPPAPPAPAAGPPPPAAFPVPVLAPEPTRAAPTAAVPVGTVERPDEPKVSSPPLLWPLVSLAAGVAALAASLAFYCSRAAVLYGSDCLSHLAHDILLW
jgi:general secretion pathway protein A